MDGCSGSPEEWKRSLQGFCRHGNRCCGTHLNKGWKKTAQRALDRNSREPLCIADAGSVIIGGMPFLSASK